MHCNIYITSICQTVVILNYFLVIQSKKSSNDNITLINNWIQWQLDNKLQSFCFKAIDLSITKLFGFIDGFFANNKD